MLLEDVGTELNQIRHFLETVAIEGRKEEIEWREVVVMTILGFVVYALFLMPVVFLIEYKKDAAI